MSTTLAKLARNASMNVAQQLWLAMLSLVATPLIYHGLGADQYGLFAVVNIVTAQLYVLEFGFGHATTKFVADAAARNDLESVGRIVSTSAAVFLVSGALGALLIAGGSSFLVGSYFRVPTELQDSGVRVLLLAALLFFLSIQTNLLGSVWRGFQRFGILSLVRGTTSTAQLLGAVVIVIVGGRVEDIVVWSVIVAFLAAATHLILLRRYHSEVSGRPGFHRPTFRTMATFGVLLMMAGILSQVYLTGGQLVLGYFVTVGLLPLYAIPFGLYQRLITVASGVAGALFPLVAEVKALGHGDRLAQIRSGGLRLLFLLTLPVVVCGVLLAGPFLRLWMGAEFAEGATVVLQAFLVAFGFAMISVPGTELARGADRPGLLVAYTGLLAALNLAGTLLLSPRFGVEGAAAALLVAQTLGAVFLVATSGAAHELMAGLLRPVALGSALVLTGVGIGFLTGNLVARAVLAIGASALYGLGAYRFGLDVAERGALDRLLPRRWRREAAGSEGS